jgi:hypothetical protein
LTPTFESLGWRVLPAGGGAMDVLWMLGFLLVWVLLQAVVLPRLGVPT